MKPDRVAADAEIAATYLSALVEKGVLMWAAVQITCSYVAAQHIAQASRDEPKEPWQE